MDVDNPQAIRSLRRLPVATQIAVWASCLFPLPINLKAVDVKAFAGFRLPAWASDQRPDQINLVFTLARRQVLGGHVSRIHELLCG